jgi:hypothetical protein
MGRASLRAALYGALLASSGAAGLRLAGLPALRAALLSHVAPADAAPSPAAQGTTPAAGIAPPVTYVSELRDPPGHTRPEVVRSPLPHTYVAQEQLPESFNWGDIGGQSYLTRALNQHVPQCACAVGALPAAAACVCVARGQRVAWACNAAAQP